MATYQFCWVWDPQCSIDVAAWTQAIGSILALGITAFLYYHQITFQRKQARKSQISSANHLAHMVDQLLNEFTETIEAGNADKKVLNFLAERMIDLHKWSSSINIETLTNDEAMLFFRIRDAIHKVSLWATLFDPVEIMKNKRFIHDLTAEIDDDLDALINLN